MTCSQSTLLASVLADCPYSEVNRLCLYSRFDTCRPCISYAWVQQHSRTNRGYCDILSFLVCLMSQLVSLLRLDNICIEFRWCCISSLPRAHPSSPFHPETCEFGVFCPIYLPLDLLTPVAGPVLAAPLEVEPITLRGSPEVHVKLKAAFCHTGMQTQVQWLVCERGLIMPW